MANTGLSVTTDLSEVTAIARGLVKSCATPPLILKLTAKLPPLLAIEP
jgi:hypothetical protein